MPTVCSLNERRTGTGIYEQNREAAIMIVIFLDVVIAGLLLEGIYALIAVGLSLQYGVARILNIAHGEFIMLGAMDTPIPEKILENQ